VSSTNNKRDWDLKPDAGTYTPEADLRRDIEIGTDGRGDGIAASPVVSRKKHGGTGMRSFVLAVMIGLLSGVAYGQTAPVPRAGEAEKDKTQQQIAAERAAEEAYKRSLGNIPDRGSADPWGNVRPDATPKPLAKAAPAKGAKGVHTAN
jgi:hypothetical protein